MDRNNKKDILYNQDGCVKNLEEMELKINNDDQSNQEDLRSNFNDLVEIALKICSDGEALSLRNKKRFCYKNIQNICHKTREMLVKKAPTTATNFKCHGALWVAKEFIFAFLRIIEGWSGLNMLLLESHNEYRRIELENYHPNLRSTFYEWQKHTGVLLSDLYETFAALDDGIRSGKISKSNHSTNSNKIRLLKHKGIKGDKDMELYLKDVYGRVTDWNVVPETPTNVQEDVEKKFMHFNIHFDSLNLQTVGVSTTVQFQKEHLVQRKFVDFSNNMESFQPDNILATSTPKVINSFMNQNMLFQHQIQERQEVCTKPTSPDTKWENAKQVAFEMIKNCKSNPVNFGDIY